MVKVAIAGASGNLALQVAKKLSESGKHEIIGLIRKDPASASLPAISGLKWTQVNYQDKSELVKTLTGVHTVLSFVVDPVTDPNGNIQKRLIDASIEAGAKRYAPSEWALGQNLEEVVEFMPFYRDKLAIREYLQEINKTKKVIEYSLFQTGLFTHLLGGPLINIKEARAVIIEGSESSEISWTITEDIAEVAARAVGYDGEWPTVGGLSGQKTTISEFLRLAEKAAGRPLDIHKVTEEDLRSGKLDESHYERIPFPGLSEEQIVHFSKVVAIAMLISMARSTWAVSDEWNKIFPDWKPTGVEEYMQKVLD